MKYLFIFVLFISFHNAQIKLSVIDLNVEKQLMKFELLNESNNTVVLFPNARYFKYSVPLHDESFKNYPFFFTLDENDSIVYLDKFPKKQIKKTAKKYGINEDEAVLFLQYSLNPIYLNPKSKNIFEWKILEKRKIVNREELKSKCVDFYGTLGFWTEYFPEKFKTSLRKNKIQLIDRIIVPKTTFKTSEFYYNID